MADFEKYSPLTLASPGSHAAHTDVCAPFSGVRKKRLTTGQTASLRRLPSPSRPKRVRTAPGWRQFTVTSAGSRRRASSLVWSMLASFERAYTDMPFAAPKRPPADCRSSKSRPLAKRWASLATMTTRAGAEACSSGRSSLTSWKWPRWFTPKVNS